MIRSLNFQHAYRSGGKLIEADTIQFKSGDRFLEDIGGMTEGINAIDQSKIDADALS